MNVSAWRLVPLEQLEPSTKPGFNWMSTGSAPVFELRPPHDTFPCGTILLRMPLRFDGEVPPLVHLFLDTGRGFHASQSVSLTFRPGKALGAIVQLPPGLRGLRLALPPCPGSLSIGDPRVRTIGYWEAVLRLGWARFRTLAWTWGGLLRAIQRALRAGRPSERGALIQFCHTYQLSPSRVGQSYQDWIRLYGTLNETERSAIRERIATWPQLPRISVLLVRPGTGQELRRSVDSLQRQIYPSWELCLTQSDNESADILGAVASQRLKIHRTDTRTSIAADWNQALSLASGEWVLTIERGAQLSEHALYLLAEELRGFPQTDALYSDEDELDSQYHRRAPKFKPDWSPDLFASHHYTGRLLVCRTDWVRAVGGFREGYPGAEEYDLLWRLLEQHPECMIRHVPHVLHHGPARTDDHLAVARDSARRAAEEHYERAAEQTTVVPNPLGPWGHRVRYPRPDPHPLVTLIVPTRDKAKLLQQCVDGLLHGTNYPAWELIIVDNQSKEGSTSRLFERYATDPRIRVLPYDHPFNYAAINNCAAREARGALLGFLNNDVEIMNPDWLCEMVSHAVRPEIGAVGARLWFPDDTLQHGGVVLGMYGRAGHLHYGLPPGHAGYEGRAILAQNISAVTGACLLTRRSIFEHVGGFDAGHLPVTYNDVDLCLRIREKGYRILWTPYAELRHHETATRGLNDTLEKQQLAERELQHMLTRWGPLFQNDPYYNPNLSLAWQDFSPAFPPRI